MYKKKKITKNEIDKVFNNPEILALGNPLELYKDLGNGFYDIGVDFVLIVNEQTKNEFVKSLFKK